LVYVAARAPMRGEDYGALAATFPKPPASAGLVASEGFAQLSEEAFLNFFAGDVDPAKARVLYAIQGRVATSLFASRTTAAAWKSKPSWYAVSKNDKTTAPELQRFLAARMKPRPSNSNQPRVADLSPEGDHRSDRGGGSPHALNCDNHTA